MGATRSPAMDAARRQETFQQSSSSVGMRAGSLFSARNGYIDARSAGNQPRENDGNRHHV
jgi:hypothetical protein